MASHASIQQLVYLVAAKWGHFADSTDFLGSLLAQLHKLACVEIQFFPFPPQNVYTKSSSWSLAGRSEQSVCLKGRSSSNRLPTV